MEWQQQNPLESLLKGQQIGPRFPQGAAKHAAGTIRAVNCSRYLQLDLNIDTCGQVEFHQGVDRLRGRLINVDNAAVGAGFKMFAGILIDVRGAKQAVDSPFRGQRDRANGCSVRPVGRIHDFFARGIEQAAIVSFEANANFLLL